MPCRISAALRSTTGLILGFFLCALFGGDRLSKGRFYSFTGLSAGLNISLVTIQEDYGVYLAASVGQDLLSRKLG